MGDELVSIRLSDADRCRGGEVVRGLLRLRVGERAVEAPLVAAGGSPEDVALVLAEAKAMDVSGRHPDSLVIGSDQTLSLGDEVLHKVKTMEDARKRLLRKVLGEYLGKPQEAARYA